MGEGYQRINWKFNVNLATGYRKIGNIEESFNNVYDSLTMGNIRELFLASY